MKFLIIAIALICVQNLKAQTEAATEDPVNEETRTKQIKLINDMLLCKQALLSNNGTAVSRNSSDISSKPSETTPQPLFTFDRVCNINDIKEVEQKSSQKNKFEIYSLNKSADGSFFVGQADSVIQGRCFSFGLTGLNIPFRFPDQQNKMICKTAEVGVLLPFTVQNQSDANCTAPDTLPIQLGTKKASNIIAKFYKEFRDDFSSLSRDKKELASNKYQSLFQHPNIHNCESLANTNALPEFLSSYATKAKESFDKIKFVQKDSAETPKLQAPSQPETSKAPGQR